jgi:integrase
MVRAELLGAHTHPAADGTNVHIWQRGAVYLARGRYQRQRFGESLGDEEKRAAMRLMEVIATIGNGTYVVPSTRRDQLIAPVTNARITIRDLVSDFLTEKRKVIGKGTTDDYRARLVRLIQFSELASSRKRWPIANAIDREFVLGLREFVLTQLVSPNGRPAATQKRVSPGYVYNIMDCSRSLFNWATDIQVAKLPLTFANPFSADLVGHRPTKDPLRPQLFPLAERIQIVEQMDEWQLPHLALSFVLPLRPEDYAGLLIEDVDFAKGDLRFGTRFGGSDFNKGRVDFTVPCPRSLMPLLNYMRGDRTSGPLLRSPPIWYGRRWPRRVTDASHNASWHIENALSSAPTNNVKTTQDRKKLVRCVIVELGGVSKDTLANQFTKVAAVAGLKKRGRYYDLKAAVSTEMEHAGVSHLVQRYVSGHTTKDILFQYASVDPRHEMQKYFVAVQPLLDAMLVRAQQLELKLPI